MFTLSKCLLDLSRTRWQAGRRNIQQAWGTMKEISSAKFEISPQCWRRLWWYFLTQMGSHRVGTLPPNVIKWKPMMAMCSNLKKKGKKRKENHQINIMSPYRSCGVIPGVRKTRVRIAPWLLGEPYFPISTKNTPLRLLQAVNSISNISYWHQCKKYIGQSKQNHTAANISF